MATRRGMSLEEEIARATGVLLPDGRRYRNGVITSAEDAGRSAESAATARALSLQAGPRPLGGFAGDSQRAAESARLDPATNPNLRPIAGAQRLANLMALQPAPFPTASEGAVLRRSALPALDANQARATLGANAGALFNRDYSPTALARATPAQLQLEASRLPELMTAQATLRAADGLLPERVYTREALARATPEQLLAEASVLPLRLDADRARRRRAVDAAALTGLQADGGEPQADPEARAAQIDAAALAAARRVAAAGGTAQDAQAAAALARQTLDPTGEVQFGRQLRRDAAAQESRLNLEDQRLNAREAARMEREDRAGVQYLKLADELEQAQQALTQATALTPQQEAAVMQAALEDADVGDGFLGIGNTRAKIKNLSDARRVLARDPALLADLEDAYQQIAQPYIQANLTLAPAQAAARKVTRAESRVKALERRGVLPTERSYALFDAERGAAPAPVTLDAETGRPVAAAPAAGALTAADLAAVFPPAAGPRAPFRVVPSLGRALSEDGVLSMLSPNSRVTMGVAERIAPGLASAGGWLRDLLTGGANYAANTNQQMADAIVSSTTELPARVVAGERGVNFLRRVDDGIARTLAAPFTLESDIRARNTLERIERANRARLAAARRLGLPDDATLAEIDAASRRILTSLR